MALDDVGVSRDDARVDRRTRLEICLPRPSSLPARTLAIPLEGLPQPKNKGAME